MIARLIAATAMTALVAWPHLPTRTEVPMTSSMLKLTPVLTVDRIEPCLSFWTERLGFKQTVGVPEGDHLGFVILEKDGIEVMYQTVESVKQDIGTVGTGKSANMLFLEVGDVDVVERAMKGVEAVVPRRTTFYGMDEVVVREPGGSVVIFAQKKAQ